MLGAMAEAVAQAGDPAQMAAAARALLGAVGPQRMLEALRGITGAQAETRREAIAVAAVLAERQPALARDIFAGAIALRETRPVDLPAVEVERAASAVIGDAFSELPAARAQLVSAARALYAGSLARQGREAQPFNAREFRQAIERIQAFADYGGRRVPLPEGMSEDRFAAVMYALPPERLANAVAADGRPITPAMVARGGFELLAVGPGRYMLRFGGREVLDATRPGQAFVLDLNGAEPAPGAPRSRQDARERALEELARQRRQGSVLTPQGGAP